MTDEQLRAMARRVLGLVAQHYTPQSVRHGKRIYLLPETMPDADEVEAAAVAIMREEMAKAAFDNEMMAAASANFRALPSVPWENFTATT